MTVTSASMSSAQTALAVLTGGGGPAPGKPTTAPARVESPAVVIDTSTARLAETARAAAAQGEASVVRVGPADRSDAAVQAFFEMADDADRLVEQTRQGLVRAKEMVRLYGETGEIYSPDQHGKLQPDRDTTRATAAQKQEIVEGVRRGIPAFERHIPALILIAREKREGAENYANVMRGR